MKKLFFTLASMLMAIIGNAHNMIQHEDLLDSIDH